MPCENARNRTTMPGPRVVASQQLFWHDMANKQASGVHPIRAPCSFQVHACPSASLLLVCTQNSVRPIMAALEKGGFVCNAMPAVPCSSFASLNREDLKGLDLNVRQVACVLAAQSGGSALQSYSLILPIWLSHDSFTAWFVRM